MVTRPVLSKIDASRRARESSTITPIPVSRTKDGLAILEIPPGNDSILGDSDAMVWIAMDPIPQPAPPRRRFQRGSLQKRKSRGCWHWIAFWWEDHRRRSQILGPCSEMSRPEALTAMAKRWRPSMHRRVLSPQDLW